LKGFFLNGSEFSFFAVLFDYLRVRFFLLFSIWVFAIVTSTFPSSSSSSSAAAATTTTTAAAASTASSLIREDPRFQSPQFSLFFSSFFKLGRHYEGLEPPAHHYL